MIQTIIADGKAEFDYLKALKARQQETNADVTRSVQAILDDVRREGDACLLYTSPSPRDGLLSRMPSSA